MPSFYDYEFCQKFDCRNGRLVPGLRNGFAARQWLGQFKHDAAALLRMRSLLTGQGKAWNLSQLSDESVLGEIANLMSSGRLHWHVRRGTVLAAPGQKSALTRERKSDKFVAFPLAWRKPAAAFSSSRQPAVDPPTFPLHINAAAQATVFLAAAAQGAPFCPI